MCRRAGCCAANDPDYCCLPPRHSRCMLWAQFPPRAAICHPCPSAHPPPLPDLHLPSLCSRRHAELQRQMPRTSLFVFLICHLALPQLDSPVSQTLFQTPCAPHSSDAYSHSPRPPPLPSVIRRRRRGGGGGMSHLQPRWKRTLAVTTSSSSSSSVTVWTLMKKRWVLSCAPIYLSGQGTCTLIPASLSLPLSLSCLTVALSSALSVASNVMQCFNWNIIITSLAKMVIVFGKCLFSLVDSFMVCAPASLNRGLLLAQINLVLFLY